MHPSSSRKRKRSRGSKIARALIVGISTIYVTNIALHKKTSTAVQKDLLTKDDIAEAIETGKKKYSSGVLDASILEKIYENVGSYGAENLWEDILSKGSEIMENSKKNLENEEEEVHLVVFEVGAHQARQSLMAARAHFHTYCIEPSPISFERIHKTMARKVKEEKDDPSLVEYIHLYNVAAADKSGEMLDFRTSGGTGDGVGRFDIWNMKEGEEPEHFPQRKKSKMVSIPSMKLDDIIFYNKASAKPGQLSGLEGGSNPPKIDKVFAMKIDTQGYEPKVFAGLKQSIRNQRIEYIITEIWPNGMALYDKRPTCQIVVDLLSTLIEAGYKLFALPLVVHNSIRDKGIHSVLANWKRRPLHDIQSDCEYIIGLEKEFKNEDYHLGYWTDVLAIAPYAEPIEPKKFKMKR